MKFCGVNVRVSAVEVVEVSVRHFHNLVENEMSVRERERKITLVNEL